MILGPTNIIGFHLLRFFRMDARGNTILNIDHLACIYDTDPVLVCDDLTLNRGDIHFMVGKSGMGKSTFLEAIGLMTDTISADSKVHFEGYEKNLKEIWSDGTYEISGFRKKNCSFIFQNTNLMSNFSAGENMCFGKMISGASYEESKKGVLKLMEAMDLDEDLFDRNIFRLSGGQRQRLAFIRAFTADFEVMFCDEPTGNLDAIIANKLMKFMKNSIKATDKTAVIVSHDVDLALKYADKIFIIKPESTPNVHGYLSPDTTIAKSEGLWTSLTGRAILNPRDFIFKNMSENGKS